MATALPFNAYQGNDPYLFASYAHADCGMVYPELKWMHQLGYRIWYDEGIELGHEWSEAIAQAIEHSTQFLVFLSPRAVISNHVREEIYFAMSRKKSILSVYLEPTELPVGLDMRLGPYQDIKKSVVPNDVFRGKVVRSLATELKANSGDEPPLVAPPNPAVMQTGVPISASGDRDQSAGETFTNSLGMEMVWCPPGEFVMGSPETDECRKKDERQHLVTLSRGFWISRYPVTQEQWESLMGSNPSHFTESGPMAPVEQINWDEAVAFCQQLNEREREGLPTDSEYRLPTEAQWEYACRAGTTGTYAGFSLEELGWFDGNSEGKTKPVGQKAANPWGLHDFHGNVYEWCQDWYGEYPDGIRVDPVGPAQGKCRVARGGGWNESARFCRSAVRAFGDPDCPCNYFGFRPALSPTS